MTDKADKEAAKAAKNAEKLQQVENQVEADFAEKNKNGKSGSPIDQLKIWLDNTPFKSQNVQLKRDTLFHILTCIQALKANDVDEMCKQLNDKLILTLSKYIFKTFELITYGDFEVINIVQNGQ